MDLENFGFEDLEGAVTCVLFLIRVPTYRTYLFACCCCVCFGVDIGSRAGPCVVEPDRPVRLPDHPAIQE